jgi:glycosyltransferase involved in cell wall biosynthesis
MKISIVTISQHTRFPVLQLLVKHILAQTIQPNEWVIVEGSKSKEDAELHGANIATLSTPFPIVYIPYQGDTKLGELRNRGNVACTGDITVCMDDDDYYPPNRIQHVVEQFKKYPQAEIAGCSNVLLYEYSLHKFYQCVGFHANHGTNNTFAWRSSFIKKHRHDPTKSNAEEASFTNEFTEKMIPLDPKSTVIVSSHTANTFDKRNLIQNNPRFKLLPHSAIYGIIPEEVYKQYDEFFASRNKEK